MILSRTQATNLVSDNKILQSLPEMLRFVELYSETRKRLAATAGCKKCQERAALAPIGDRVLVFIHRLPKDRIAALRAFLAVSRLFIYDPSKPPEKKMLIEL